MVYFWLFILLITTTFAEEPYKKVLSNDPEAKCLDGSQPFVYYHEGTESGKFLVHFNVGGFCEGMSLDDTLSNCYDRSKTDLGSSKNWPDTLVMQGILSTNPDINNLASWTKIVIGYCDGSLHQGNRQAPISYKGDKLYFKGAVNTRAHFSWIMSKFPLFKNPQQIVISGASSAFLWTNYVRSLVSNASNVETIVDSGVLILSKTYETGVDMLLTNAMSMFKLSNIDEKTPLQMCNAKYKDEQYKCLFMQYAWTSLQSRTLVINSEYDSAMLSIFLQVKCLTNGTTEHSLANCSQQEMAFIEQYRTQFKDFMEYFMMYSKNNAWTIGCSNHGYTTKNKFYNADTQKVPAETGLKIQEAIKLFLDKQRVHAEETDPWPSNTGCAK